ncbi:hypothetical protein Bca4012_005923 [Brassica carinata]
MAGQGPSFSKSENIPEVDVSTPIGPEIVSKPAKPTLPEPLERRRFLVGVGGAGVGAGAVWVVVHPELPITQCVVGPVGSVVIHVRVHLHPLPVVTFFIVL